MLIDINDMPLVAMEFMNDVHSQDVEIINQLFTLILTYETQKNEENQSKIDLKYEEWYKHTIEHFQGEEKKMKEKNFPPYPIHKSEHDNALKVMDETFKKWQSTHDIQILKRYFIEVLPQWLTHHIQTMDTVTAMFFKTGMSPCSLQN